ncbi:hypothetical protein L1987_44034 [Smallanthus sonchifolius]|uniref:Uncharacterized protein n=1 Tax=Smallanthus sonchifolius TaxID=185202 RepID=A0ACB9GNZ1_9ASTR|nr:hypothetical protein L1987_44034 [Smallanthus sonchifolius]
MQGPTTNQIACNNQFFISNNQHQLITTNKAKMFNGRGPIGYTIIWLSMILMIIMIKDCDGWTAACNGSTEAECLALAEEEQEFMMDTEEHKRILAVAKKPAGVIGYGSLDAPKPFCGSDCPGTYARCTTYNRCKK